MTLPISMSTSATATPLPPDWEPLRTAAAAAEAAGELQPAQMGVIHGNQWLKMLAPCDLGGGEWSLPDVVRLEEAVACADGSCGWVVTLCAGAGWFAGFLPPELGRRLMTTPKACLAGSGAVGGYADRDGDRWRLGGRWGHASGAPWATHFTLNAQLREGGLPLLDQHGQPRVRAFVVPAADVQVERNSWHSIGLRASASCAFSLADVLVAADQAFDIDASAATARGPLYRFPFESLAYVTLAACVAGMARHFIDLAKELTDRRIPQLGVASAVAQERWNSGAQALRGARDVFYGALDTAWDRIEGGAPSEALQERRLNEAACALARVAREAVDSIYPVCGLHAADPRTEINRVWRDLHTATQHALWLR